MCVPLSLWHLMLYLNVKYQVYTPIWFLMFVGF